MMREMYIDDCIVFADTNDEFISRLDSVFGRFRKQANVHLDSKNLNLLEKLCQKQG